MTSQENPLTGLSDSMAAAVEKAGAGTVLVDGRQRFPATGVVYASDLVLTADHVVERDEGVRIVLADGTELTASQAGRDPGNDLAVLRLEQAIAHPAVLAEGEPRVGQLALALGRPTLEGIQASLGIVSAIGGPVRTRRGGLLEGYLRTDAIPYPGFSGGPLVDSAGQILGINTSGLGVGASLAIPGKVAWKVAAVLAEHGSIKRGFLGVRSQPVEIPAEAAKSLGREQATGLLIIEVEAGTPAEAGGLMVGDILVGINDQPVAEHDELFVQLSGDIVGRETPVEVLRGGQRQVLGVKIGEREDHPVERPHPRMFWHGRRGRGR